MPAYYDYIKAEERCKIDASKCRRECNTGLKPLGTRTDDIIENWIKIGN